VATIYTVGHSNRTIDAFLATIEAHGVRAIADVRRVPQSRRHPQFNRKLLAASLADDEVAYAWIEALGGRREASDETIHTAIDAPFAGYAEHTRTPEFARGIDLLLALASEGPTAAMCAEKSFEECHRRILSDWLVANGHEVVHLLDGGHAIDHALSAEARATPAGLVYDRGTQPQLL
jgi:uncharacterized protein (DUF488 family)